MQPNHRARQIVESLIEGANVWQVEPLAVAGATVVDCGVQTRGGLEAGRFMARAALAGLGEVTLQRDERWPGPGVSVVVRTDQPAWACLASQYAGWPIQAEGYFAMASGPMRLLRGREPLLEAFSSSFQESTAVGLLESSRLPPEELVREIAQACGVQLKELVLLVAPTRSLAGTLQVVARSVETALHKLHEITREEAFDLHAVISASGAAPLPPPSNDDLVAIGRTNDAILYGADVTLWIDADDERIEAWTERLPSATSPDYGEPFAEIFRRVGGDFYAIDPLLFSPAAVRLISVQSGRTFTAGSIAPELLARSFGGDSA